MSLSDLVCAIYVEGGGLFGNKIGRDRQIYPPPSGWRNGRCAGRMAISYALTVALIIFFLVGKLFMKNQRRLLRELAGCWPSKFFCFTKWKRFQDFLILGCQWDWQFDNSYSPIKFCPAHHHRRLAMIERSRMKTRTEKKNCLFDRWFLLSVRRKRNEPKITEFEYFEVGALRVVDSIWISFFFSLLILLFIRLDLFTNSRASFVNINAGVVVVPISTSVVLNDTVKKKKTKQTSFSTSHKWSLLKYTNSRRLFMPLLTQISDRIGSIGFFDFHSRVLNLTITRQVFFF